MVIHPSCVNVFSRPSFNRVWLHVVIVSLDGLHAFECSAVSVRWLNAKACSRQQKQQPRLCITNTALSSHAASDLPFHAHCLPFGQHRLSLRFKISVKFHFESFGTWFAILFDFFLLSSDIVQNWCHFITIRQRHCVPFGAAPWGWRCHADWGRNDGCHGICVGCHGIFPCHAGCRGPLTRLGLAWLFLRL